MAGTDVGRAALDELAQRLAAALGSGRLDALEWLVLLCATDRSSLDAMLGGGVAEERRVALEAALAKFAAVDGEAAASWLGKAMSEVVDGAVVVAAEGEVGDAQPL